MKHSRPSGKKAINDGTFAICLLNFTDFHEEIRKIHRDSQTQLIYEQGINKGQHYFTLHFDKSQAKSWFSQV